MARFCGRHTSLLVGEYVFLKNMQAFLCSEEDSAYMPLVRHFIVNVLDDRAGKHLPQRPERRLSQRPQSLPELLGDCPAGWQGSGALWERQCAASCADKR
ncbi:MAG: hypothetical protein BCS36_02785 [Desulfovibrio sp. MES5]|nr:MAG: hypothetical protein BCS36_02785 [Desulfovibrio sp. MES5]